MELGDFGGGVGVLLRDEDSLGVETSEEKGQRLIAIEEIRRSSLLAWFYMILSEIGKVP